MSFSFFFSFEKEELGEGVRLFFRTNLLFFDLHNSEVLSNLLFKHIDFYNKARKGTGISLEIALGSNRKNA